MSSSFSGVRQVFLNLSQLNILCNWPQVKRTERQTDRHYDSQYALSNALRRVILQSQDCQMWPQETTNIPL